MILIHPHSSGFGFLQKFVPLTLPMGIGVLAGYLISRSKQVKIIDEAVTPLTPELLTAKTRDLSPPYIWGISSVTNSIGRSYEISRILKEMYPTSKVILGGIHPTVLPEEALRHGSIDVVVRGEGEEALDLLYETTKKQQYNFKDIPNISYKSENGEIISNPGGRLFPNLDALPPFPYHLFDISHYDISGISSSRGCPYKCNFCSQRQITGNKYRYRSSENVCRDIDLLINKYNQNNIGFLDDNFLLNKKRVKELCLAIIDRGFHKKAEFELQARADNVDEDILEHLRSARFTTIGFGIETASERLMKIIEKGETVQKHIEAVRLTQKYGFRVGLFFIFGLPTETHEDRVEALTLAKRLNVEFAKFNNAVPYPGTALYEIAKGENRLTIVKSWENFNSVMSFVEWPFEKIRLPYCPSTSSEMELRHDIQKANLFFYLSPHKIVRLIFSKSNNRWFLLSDRWYLKPDRLYYLFKLFINVTAIFVKVVILDLIFLTNKLTKGGLLGNKSTDVQVVEKVKEIGNL